MSNFFERELQNLFEDGKVIQSPAFVGQTCFGTLDKSLRVRAQFISTNVIHEYDALKLTVLSRTDGPVDTVVLNLKDLMGKEPVPNNPNSRDGTALCLWDHDGKIEWYACQPTAADRQALRQAVGQYLNVFREQTQERMHEGPKMVYICAPLRGEVEKNIEFARQKAREVFQAGDIPVCPHLMFPPTADPDHPMEDQAAREMGLRLVESCQQVNVYGPTWAEGMWAEIHHAEKLDIPVMTDQKQLGKAPPCRNRKQER